MGQRGDGVFCCSLKDRPRRKNRRKDGKEGQGLQRLVVGLWMVEEGREAAKWAGKASFQLSHSRPLWATVEEHLRQNHGRRVSRPRSWLCTHRPCDLSQVPSLPCVSGSSLSSQG